jgi:hypothetical protein
MNQIDHLISSLGEVTPTADESEDEPLRAARRVLRAAIATERARRARRRRGRAIALFAALAIIGVAVPALGVVGDGWIPHGEIEGVRGSADPKLTGPPVVVASGEPEHPWKIVIARSNQGLCLNVDVGDQQFSSEKHRLGNCGYSDVRGDLPSDVRGDPSAPCIGLSVLMPCGSRPKTWLQMRAGVFVAEAARVILVGAAAAEVASVEIILANGETLHAEVAERPLGRDVPLNVFWAELGPEHGLRLLGQLPCEGDDWAMAIARNADGHVLGRRARAWNGNPSGDPAGPRPPRSTEDECV